eukprot:15485361-Alexandrium_andersonii.AAC.3
MAPLQGSYHPPAPSPTPPTPTSASCVQRAFVRGPGLGGSPGEAARRRCWLEGPGGGGGPHREAAQETARNSIFCLLSCLGSAHIGPWPPREQESGPQLCGRTRLLAEPSPEASMRGEGGGAHRRRPGPACPRAQRPGQHVLRAATARCVRRAGRPEPSGACPDSPGAQRLFCWISEFSKGLPSFLEASGPSWGLRRPLELSSCAWWPVEPFGAIGGASWFSGALQGHAGEALAAACRIKWPDNAIPALAAPWGQATPALTEPPRCRQRAPPVVQWAEARFPPWLAPGPSHSGTLFGLLSVDVFSFSSRNRGIALCWSLQSQRWAANAIPALHISHDDQ